MTSTRVLSNRELFLLQAAARAEAEEEAQELWAREMKGWEDSLLSRQRKWLIKSSNSLERRSAKRSPMGRQMEWLKKKWLLNNSDSSKMREITTILMKKVKTMKITKTNKWTEKSILISCLISSPSLITCSPIQWSIQTNLEACIILSLIISLITLIPLCLINSLLRVQKEKILLKFKKIINWVRAIRVQSRNLETSPLIYCHLTLWIPSFLLNKNLSCKSLVHAKKLKK